MFILDLGSVTNGKVKIRDIWRNCYIMCLWLSIKVHSAHTMTVYVFIQHYNIINLPFDKSNEQILIYVKYLLKGALRATNLCQHLIRLKYDFHD